MDRGYCDGSVKHRCNWQLCVGGGMRSPKNAAAVMPLYTIRRRDDGRYEYELVMRAGLLLSNIRSAFMAEGVALEWAIATFPKMNKDM